MNVNINRDELYYLKTFIKEKPFTVLECDKNIGLAIIDSTEYNNLCEKMLNDSNTYKKLEFNPLIETVDQITKTLSDLKKLKHIKNDRLYKILLPKNSNCGKFRILPKLHKAKFGCRPIIYYQNNPTSNIARFSEYFLHPFVEKLDSFLKDSQNLMQDTLNLRQDKNSYLYSLDFESLYTNINLADALNIITNFASDKIDSDYLDITAFYNIFKLFFYSNIFVFDDKYYKQILGIGMGSVFGPTCANIVVYHYENTWYNIHKPIYYKRFIDDIFVILNNEEKLNILLNSFDYLKLNYITGEIVNFLDLNISINKISRQLHFSLYIKETNTFSYLLTNSNHPSHIIKKIPKSLLVRVRKNCSSYSDFLYNAGMTCFHLEKRNYDKNVIMKVI